MCTGFYQKLQQYYENQEWELTKLAVALYHGGWYAKVTWEHGNLMLIVRSQRSMAEWKAEKQKITQRVIA